MAVVDCKIKTRVALVLSRCLQTGAGLLLGAGEVRGEGAEALRVQHRVGQLPRGARHPPQRLGRRGQVGQTNPRAHPKP